MNDVSSHLSDSQAKYFQHLASTGSRIGSLTKNLLELEQRHEQMSHAFNEKAKTLFSKKDPSKWENPEVVRMTKVDQEELLKDPSSMQLIAPQDQLAMWKTRQMHAALISA